MQYNWEDKYSTGIKAIDEQHKHFIQLFNEFDEKVNKFSAGEDTLEQELQILSDDLLNYALYHFSEEEIYLKKCRCETCEQHISDHDSYRKTISDYRQKIRELSNDKSDFFSKIRDYAEKYFIKHIQNGHEKGFLKCFVDSANKKRP